MLVAKCTHRKDFAEVMHNPSMRRPRNPFDHWAAEAINIIADSRYSPTTTHHHLVSSTYSVSKANSQTLRRLDPSELSPHSVSIASMSQTTDVF